MVCRCVFFLSGLSEPWRTVIIPKKCPIFFRKFSFLLRTTKKWTLLI